jgi:hypothetical protein
MSIYGPRKNEKCKLPGKPLTDYLEFRDAELAREYAGRHRKIPMQIAHDAYFEGKIDFKGDVFDILEYRFDWADFRMTPELFRYVFCNLVPDVLFHTSAQDAEQVGDTYNRGNDFYGWSGDKHQTCLMSWLMMGPGSWDRG